MSKKNEEPKKDLGPKASKKAYKKPKLKVIKLDKTIVHATDNCGGCGY